MEGDRAVYPARPVVGAVGGRCPGGRSSAAVRFGPVWRSCCGLQAAALYSLGTVVGIGSSWSVAAMASSRTGASGVLHVSASGTADSGHFRSASCTGSGIGQDASCPGSADDRAAGRAARCHGATVPRCCGSWGGRAARCRNARREWTIGWSCRAVQRRPSVFGPTSLWMFSTASRSGARLCGWLRSSGPAAVA